MIQAYYQLIYSPQKEFQLYLKELCINLTYNE